MLYEDEEADFKLPFGQEEKAGVSSEEEEDEEAEVEEKKPEAKAGSGGFMSKFSLAGITIVYVNILSNIIIIHYNVIIISLQYIIIIILNIILLFSKLNI